MHFGNTSAKIIWTYSHWGFNHIDCDTMATTLINGPMDALRVNMTPALKKPLQNLRLSIEKGIEQKRPDLNTHGFMPFLLSFIGRKALLKLPDANRLEMQPGQTLVCQFEASYKLTTELETSAGNPDPHVYFSAQDMLAEVKPGMRFAVSYGQTNCVVKQVTKVTDTHFTVTLEWENHGFLLSGMEFHSTEMPRRLFPLIPEDEELVRQRFFGLADYLILNGVRSVEEIKQLRRAFTGEAAPHSTRHPSVAINKAVLDLQAPIAPRFILKIESTEVLGQIDEFLPYVDGVFLSRSELSLTVHPHSLPIVQKDVLATCNDQAKLVIVASELLYSMRVNPNPTRAEVSDLANAVADGTDAILLSEEVTEGPHSTEVARYAGEIIKNSEANVDANWQRIPTQVKNEDDAIAYGALQVAKNTKAKAIVCLTEGGYTAFRLSSFRTPAHIIAITYNQNVMRQLALLRSVFAVTLESAPSFDKILEAAKKILVESCGFAMGERFVFVSLTASSVSARNSNLFTVQEV